MAFIHGGKRVIVLYIYHGAKFKGPGTKLVFLPLCNVSSLPSARMFWYGAAAFECDWKSHDFREISADFSPETNFLAGTA